MISETINKQIADAMKSRDEIRLSTLRLLLSALNYEKIDKQHDLNKEEETVVVRREAKKRKDAIEIYEKAKANDRADREKKELEILEEYLPKQISDEDLEKLVDEAVKKLDAKEMKDMGKVIGYVMQKAKGRAEGGKVADIVKARLGV